MADADKGRPDDLEEICSDTTFFSSETESEEVRVTNMDGHELDLVDNLYSDNDTSFIDERHTSSDCASKLREIIDDSKDLLHCSNDCENVEPANMSNGSFPLDDSSHSFCLQLSGDETPFGSQEMVGTSSPTKKIKVLIHV